jgi:hypothetical protein
MTRRKALEWWETKVRNFEVTPQAIWPDVKVPITIQGPLGPKCQPTEKAKTVTDYLENQFTLHDLCDENHKRWVEA